MDTTMVTSLIAVVSAGSGRVLQVWLRERAATEKERVHQQALSGRVLRLPPGSRLLEHHPQHGSTIVEVGTLTKGGSSLG